MVAIEGGTRDHATMMEMTVLVVLEACTLMLAGTSHWCFAAAAKEAATVEFKGGGGAAELL